MATLDNKSVKRTLSAVVKYNSNPDKNRPTDGLFAAAAYISGGHSVEKLYSRGHNGCSGTPELALRQFKASEKLYYKKKSGAREAGMGRYEMEPERYSKKFKVPMDQIKLNENGKVWVEKQPTIAEHFFLSFPPEEEVSYDTQCKIADELCSSPLLKDFYAISNRHYNTDNDHSHILVSNYSKDGSKKLSINNAKRNELRKELDRICVSYGLSIIDDPALRKNDPEREQFIRDLVNNGTVNVYAPADYKKLLKPEREYDRWMLQQIKAGRVKIAQDVSQNREWDKQQEKYRSVSQEEAYRKWIAKQEFVIREKDKKAAQQKMYVFLKEEDKKKKKAQRLYYWDDRYRSSKYPDCTYAVRRYDDKGYRKPFIVFMIELIFSISLNEENYYKERYPNSKPREAYFGPPLKEAQIMFDNMKYMREQGVNTPNELDSRISVVGAELSEVRRGKAYYQKVFEDSTALEKAIDTFNELNTQKENGAVLTEEEELVWKEAYRIMASHKCTTLPEQFDLYKRRKYAEGKIVQLEEHEKRLKKDYHDLKFIESHTADIQRRVEYYTFQNQGTHSLEDLIARAVPTQNHDTTKISEISKNF